ncbi:class I SAM-dependent methyltransferase [Methylobacterium oryzae]|uniref:Methyltransferase n=1 Tax=Methylobacterium oryzae TaxID=334852 RepID=A0ABU7U0H2_9HYPH
MVGSKVFPPSSWEADRQARFEIEPSTALFHRSVPSLKYLNWKIEEIGRGWAVTRLPLNVESSNQYITQQAALMLLAADYTGGIALSTLFLNTPIIGFHPQRTDYGAYLWGAAASIKWVRPSTSDLICKSAIPERDWDEIAQRFDAGEEVRYKARIKMYSDENKLAAVSDFQYWARNSYSLRETGSNLKTTHHMLTHKLRTSARLIAGLRSWAVDPNDPGGRKIDQFASNAAGAQGIAMAKKFSAETPQLADLVRARTFSCDAALRAFSQLHDEFAVVNIGSGYDARPWRMPDLGGAHFVMLDLPVMAKDRERVLPARSESPYLISNLTFDILSQNISEVLAGESIPHDCPKFILWEGGSMYFSKEEADRLLRSIKDLMCHQSVLWFDFVSKSAVVDATGEPEVKNFMDSMRMIGEPFIKGFDDVLEELKDVGLDVFELATAKEVLNSSDPVTRHYSFALCRKPDRGMGCNEQTVQRGRPLCYTSDVE